MFYLLLSIIGSALISIIMRLSTNRVSARLSMLCANYFMCLSLAAAFSGFRVFPGGEEGLGGALGMGIFNGALYLSSFILLQYNTGKSGVVLSSVFMKLGLLVPMAASTLLFGEFPTGVQIAGFVIADISMGMLLLEAVVNHGLFGAFLEPIGSMVNGSMFNPKHPTADAQGFRQDFIDGLKEAALPCVRLPGGNFVSGFNWEYSVGPNRPKRLDLAWFTTETNEFGLHEFCDWWKKARA